MRNTLTVAAFVLLGCKGADSDTSPDSGSSETATETGETGDLAPTEPMATGTIGMRDPEMELSADVSLWKAFSYYTDDATLVYATNAKDVSCASVATMLTGKKEVDPNAILLDNSCNLLIQGTFKPNRPNYDIQTDQGGIASIYCPFGEGQWEWKEGWKGERWYWSGTYYTASAWKGTFGLTVDENDVITVPLELREYEGTFPLSESGSTQEHKASGKLAGTLKTEHCSKLSNTSWF
jgi:hypothetical protein